MADAQTGTGIDAVIAAGPYRADWESLETQRVPDWYLNGKFGIFIHWGVYAVPAFGSEWYPRNMYRKDSKEFAHHVATYGPQSEFGYKDFIPQFKAENYDPEAWAALFAASGAKFVVPVAEHHDGFPLYDSALTDWCASKMGPHRDVIGDMAEATRRHGLVFGTSSHRAEHWWFFDGGRTFDSDVQNPQFEDFYGPAQPGPADSHDITQNPPNAAFLDDWLARTCEIVDKYRPQLVWFDWWIHQEAFRPYLQRFAAYYYNRAVEWAHNGLTPAPGVAINYKYEAFPAKAAVLDIERGQLDGIRPLFWQTDTAISKNSWGYVEQQDYKTVTSLITDLIDIVSKNGALLLNIGPRPDGTIPEQEQQMLREIGKWLEINGEAIYHTRPWAIYGEGPTEVIGGAFNDTKRAPFTGQDIRFTTKGNILYALPLAWPGPLLTIHELGTETEQEVPDIASIYLLGHEEELTWTRDEVGLKIHLPPTPPCDHAYALKIEHI